VTFALATLAVPAAAVHGAPEGWVAMMTSLGVDGPARSAAS